MLRRTAIPVRSPAPDARALYLGGQGPKSITCTDDALVVRNERGQTMRYPLARVARVVSSTVVDWRGDTLALCMRNGISITWQDGRGNCLGTCYPQALDTPAFGLAVELWLQSPHGLEGYQNWFKNRRMAVLVHWAHTSAAQISPLLWEHTKRQWVYGQTIEAHLAPGLRSHCQAYVASQLSRQQIDPVFWGPQAQAIALSTDLAGLLWADMNLSTGRLVDAVVGENELITLFERWVACNAAALPEHLHALFRCAIKSQYH